MEARPGINLVGKDEGGEKQLQRSEVRLPSGEKGGKKKKRGPRGSFNNSNKERGKEKLEREIRGVTAGVKQAKGGGKTGNRRYLNFTSQKEDIAKT